MIDPSLLWFIHGRAYDLRPFLRVHPGGAEALLQERGQDCTVCVCGCGCVWFG